MNLAIQTLHTATDTVGSSSAAKGPTNELAFQSVLDSARPPAKPEDTQAAERAKVKTKEVEANKPGQIAKKADNKPSKEKELGASARQSLLALIVSVPLPVELAQPAGNAPSPAAAAAGNGPTPGGHAINGDLQGNGLPGFPETASQALPDALPVLPMSKLSNDVIGAQSLAEAAGQGNSDRAQSASARPALQNGIPSGADPQPNAKAAPAATQHVRAPGIGEKLIDGSTAAAPSSVAPPAGGAAALASGQAAERHLQVSSAPPAAQTLGFSPTLQVTPVARATSGDSVHFASRNALVRGTSNAGVHGSPVQEGDGEQR